ncbi:histidine kinase dimerization/phosphoacceptor domain-containing protein [Neobacillus pocheonensis]|uniref:histidine kinase n=1 Tax=Neobacillus pocheonensis TaxID=363869 RepID=A0ABT0W7X4_9BACI|nr:histidine kinase dimerization/phosphoacceptor domain-containing protein [Neobacillus pocheonensis]
MQHLEELNKAYSDLKIAHDELQEANIVSMRYAALAERAKIARDIHDGLGHNMTSLIIQLQVLEVMLTNNKDEASKKINEILAIAHEGMEEVRRAVREWANDNEMLGLVALRGLITQTEAIHNYAVNSWRRVPFRNGPLKQVPFYIVYCRKHLQMFCFIVKLP